MWKNWRRRDKDGAEDRTEYAAYHLMAKDVAVCLGKSAAITGAFSYMFYRSWAGFLLWPAMAAFWIKRDAKEKGRARRERLSLQFKDTIMAVISGMQAGYSIENAFLGAEKEMVSLYGKESEMARELALIRKGLRNQVPLEQMLLNLGRRSHVEEIQDFTEVFAVAKRQGGNLKEIIQRTAQLTQQRMDVEREISTMLAAQKYEQKVMNLIPFLLFGYLQISSRGFFDVLYHNMAGILIMTLCLALYLAAWFLSEKIMDIRI